MHTPGPWTAHETENHMHTLHDARGHHFCNLRNMRRDTSADDARLIAAAPDLLNALVAVLPYINAPVGYTEQARAAISKAMGEI